MTFEIKTTDNARQLTQSILQIIDCLNMYQAELARVLNLQCGDIGQLSSGQQLLSPDSDEWQQALLFVRLYQKLYEKFNGNGAEMIHWMRSSNNPFQQSPHLLIVDENRLEEVVTHIYE